MDLQHKHWALIILGLLVVVLAVLTAYFFLGSETVIAPAPEQATSTPSTPAVTATPVHITENAAYYDIDLTYPSATPLQSVNTNANEQAVTLMRATMQSIAAEFKKNGNFSNLSHDDVQIMGLDQRKEALSSEYKTYIGSRTVSYVVTVYEDTLGAHPNTYFRTFTFDTKTGAALNLSDLFNPGTNYLGTLSTIASQKLPAIIAEREQAKVSEVDTDYLHAGIAPEPESFQSWYISAGKLVIIFPPYQVGPYALGTIELPIPVTQLATVKADYK